MSFGFGFGLGLGQTLGLGQNFGSKCNQKPKPNDSTFQFPPIYFHKKHFSEHFRKYILGHGLIVEHNIIRDQ
jgi:hypothetical protein